MTTNYRSSTRLILSLFLMLLLAACGEKDYFIAIDEDSSDKESETKEYAKEHVSLESADEQKYLLGRTDQGVLRFTCNTPRPLIPEVGKVLFLTPSDEYPMGYYGKVSSIKETSNELLVQLSPVELHEIIPDTTFTLETTLGESLRGAFTFDQSISFSYAPNKKLSANATIGLHKGEISLTIDTHNDTTSFMSYGFYTEMTLDAGFKASLSAIEKESEPIISMPIVAFNPFPNHKLLKYLRIGIVADLGMKVVCQSTVSLGVHLEHKQAIQLGCQTVSNNQVLNQNHVSLPKSSALTFDTCDQIGGTIGFGPYMHIYPVTSFWDWSDYLNCHTDFLLQLSSSLNTNLKPDNLATAKMKAEFVIDGAICWKYYDNHSLSVTHSIPYHYNFDIWSGSLFPGVTISQVDFFKGWIGVQFIVDDSSFLIDGEWYCEQYDTKTGTLIERKKIADTLEPGDWPYIHFNYKEGVKKYTFRPVIKLGDQFYNAGKEYTSAPFDPSDL